MVSLPQIDRTSLVNTRLPNVYIRKISIGVGNVVVQLSILRDTDKQGNVLQEATEVLRNMDIKTIISFDSNLTRNLVNNNISLSKNFNDVEGAIERVYTGDNFYLDGVDQLYKTRDAEGNLYYELPFRIVIEDQRITNENPEHMACIAFACFRNINESFGTENAYSSVGKVSADIVYDNFNLQIENSILTNNEEKLWVGEFFKDRSGNLLTGYRRSANSSTLRETSIPNSKVQDFRVFNKVGALLGDSLDAMEIKEEEFVYSSSRAQFSNLYLSFDQQKEVRFLFAIDCKQIYEDNAKKTELVTEPQSFEMIMDKLRISSFQIRRRNLAVIGEEKVIVSSNEETARNFINYTQFETSNDKGEIFENGLQSTPIASIKEIFLNLTNTKDFVPGQIRYFGVIDHEIAGFTSGQYQYSVEIEYEDKTERHLIEKNVSLKETLHALEDYISESEEYLNSSSNRFVEEYVFNNSENRSSFLRKSISTYIDCLVSAVDVNSTLQQELSRTLVNITHPISGNIQGLEIFAALIRNLILYNNSTFDRANTLSANSDEEHDSSIDHIKEEKYSFKVEKEFNKPEELYTIDCVNNTGIDYLYTQGQEVSGDTLATLSTDGFIQRVADEATKFSGVNESGEIVAVKSSFTLDANINQYSYLSANYVNIGDNSVDLKGNSPTNTTLGANEQFVGIDATISSRNTEKEVSNSDQRFYQDSTSTETAALNQLNAVLSDNSAEPISSSQIEDIERTVDSNGTETAEPGDFLAVKDSSLEMDNFTGNTSIVDTEEPNLIRDEDSSISNNAQSGQAIKDSSDLALVLLANGSPGKELPDNQERVNNMGDVLQITSQKLDLTSEQNFIDSLSNEELKEIPNQVFSVAKSPSKSFASPNPGEFFRDEFNNAEFNLTLGSLQTLEILTGFESSITDPLWVKLDQQNFNTIEGLALIRMRPYTNGELGIDNQLKCPAFNEHFLIGQQDTQNATFVAMAQPVINIQMNLFIPPKYIDSSPKVKEISRVSRCSTTRIPNPAPTGKQTTELSLEGIPLLEVPIAEPPVDVATNLFTEGKEFVLPDDSFYRGAYHVHPEFGPMVGATHTLTPHDRLRRVSGTPSTPAERRYMANQAASAESADVEAERRRLNALIVFLDEEIAVLTADMTILLSDRAEAEKLGQVNRLAEIKSQIAQYGQRLATKTKELEDAKAFLERM